MGRKRKHSVTDGIADAWKDHFEKEAKVDKAGYTDALLGPDAFESWGNRRHVIESTGVLKVIVKGRDRYVMTPGLGFERGQKVTVEELRRGFWKRVKAVKA